MTLGQFLDKLGKYTYDVDIYFDHAINYTGAEIGRGYYENKQTVKFFNNDFSDTLLEINSDIEISIDDSSIYIPDYKGKRIDFYFFKTEMINCLVESKS